MVELIERKKLGGSLNSEELGWICDRFVAQQIPDYQVAAWLMAVRLNGLSRRETLDLTMALMHSGATIEWPSDRPVVDKHSTGGVGDKTSLVLVPLLAAAGIIFVKMSGRGLGHTGGTLDKLESIPGFRVDLGLDEIRTQVERIGCALVGQTADLVPADGALYALRDVTSTVDSIPLIASSIMSKKLAGGARAIVLDVKYGAGALLPSFEMAERLAREMVEIGAGAGRRIRAVMSPMEEPLGWAVGNALEVRESIEVLAGQGPPDLRELVLELGSHLMVLAGTTPSLEDAKGGLRQLLDAGIGLEKLESLIAAQGGDGRVVRHPDLLPSAPEVVTLTATEAGWIHAVQARAVAEIALGLGAGRRRKGDRIDPRTGVRVLVKVGQRVERGQPLAELHLPSKSAAEEALRLAGEAILIEPNAPDAASRRTVVIEPEATSA